VVSYPILLRPAIHSGWTRCYFGVYEHDVEGHTELDFDHVYVLKKSRAESGHRSEMGVTSRFTLEAEEKQFHT
jgi:hypothetical protein